MRDSNSRPAASTSGPAVSWNRGPIRCATSPDRADNNSMSTVAGRSAVPAANADHPAPTWSS